MATPGGLADGDVMTRVLFAVLVLIASSPLAQARDLKSCAAAAETEKLTGSALGTFMTECLSGPAGSATVVEKPSGASLATRSGTTANPSPPKVVAMKASPTRPAARPETTARSPARAEDKQANA